MQGRIVNSVSGFFRISSEGIQYTCKVRGKIKASELPLVGDIVEFSVVDGKNGIIERILPRKNSFIRPAVANIDCMVFLASEVIPVTDPFLIDRVSVIAVEQNCDFILCINKSDLSVSERLYNLYKNVDFPVIVTSAETGEGITELVEQMEGKVCAFTGNSGVGKSSVINRIIPDLMLTTDVVSEKLGRGKHTTRQVSLYQINENTFVADTPGFASFDLTMMSGLDRDKLQFCFPDFTEYTGKCRFPDCLHVKEPDCALRDAVEKNKVSTSRYESYIKLLDVLTKDKYS